MEKDYQYYLSLEKDKANESEWLKVKLDSIKNGIIRLKMSSIEWDDLKSDADGGKYYAFIKQYESLLEETITDVYICELAEEVSLKDSTICNLVFKSVKECSSSGTEARDGSLRHGSKASTAIEIMREREMA